MLKESFDRLYQPKMAYYRKVYESSERWNASESLEDKTVIVYGEQGHGDQIQFCRYIHSLIEKQKPKKVYFHCDAELFRLFEQLGVECIDKNCADLPDHDFHIPSMSLPFSLQEADVSTPYLHANPINEVVEEKTDKIKVGIAWEGNPVHSNNCERCCALRHFKMMPMSNVKLFMLQKSIHTPSLVTGAEDIELYSVELNDYYDTASLIKSMDAVVTVDTSVLHLAGALGVPTFGLLSFRHDPRWDVKKWYESVTLIKQKEEGDWNSVFAKLNQLVGRKKE